MHLSRWALVACTLTLMSVLADAAQAASRSVFMGTPPQAGRSFERLQADVNDFFPHTTTIHQGDSIRFTPVGFHNVEFVGAGRRPTPLVSPTGQKISGANDAGGAPFWINSGLPLAERPKPMTVRFARRGSFTFLCNVHPGMKGRVRVRRAGADVPTAREHSRAVTRQITRARSVARELPKTTAPVNTVNVGVGGSGGVEYFGFTPSRLRVARGTTVTFRMSPATYDLHTASTGPGDPEREPNSYLGQIAAGFTQPIFDQRGVYPSEPPGTIASLSSTLHGNGFWNSGVMDRSTASPQPASSRVRFDSAGSYTFYCLIHPFMKGTVDVG